jgi:hypothetical protein
LSLWTKWIPIITDKNGIDGLYKFNHTGEFVSRQLIQILDRKALENMLKSIERDEKVGRVKVVEQRIGGSAQGENERNSGRPNRRFRRRIFGLRNSNVCEDGEVGLPGSKLFNPEVGGGPIETEKLGQRGHSKIVIIF